MHKNYTKKDIKRIMKQDMEVPKIVTHQVQQAFQQINQNYQQDKVEEKVISYRRKASFKMRVVLVAAAVMLFGTVTATGAALLKWNPMVAEKFEADEMQQDLLTAKGMAEEQSISTENNGVTIEVEQTLADDRYMYALFKITAPEEMKLDQDTFFDEFNLTSNGQEVPADHSSGVVENEDGMDNVTYWEVWIQQTEADHLKGSDITANFVNMSLLKADKIGTEALVDGVWDLTWQVPDTDVRENFAVNHEFSQYGVTVKNISITPLSMEITYDWPRNVISEQAITDDGSMTEIQYFEEPLAARSFRLKDGTTVDIPRGSMQSSGYADEAGTEYADSIAFSKVVNIDQIESVLFGEDGSEVLLKHNP